MKMTHKIMVAGGLTLATVMAVLIVTMISLDGINSDVHTLAENDLPRRVCCSISTATLIRPSSDSNGM